MFMDWKMLFAQNSISVLVRFSGYKYDLVYHLLLKIGTDLSLPTYKTIQNYYGKHLLSFEYPAS